MECTFKDELMDELKKLVIFYDYVYFNNALPYEEMKELERLIKSDRKVLDFLK